MDIEFKNIKELYKRLEPALKTKEDELIRLKINHVKKEDIWNYLKECKWVDAQNLLLHEMVDDILNCDNTFLIDYVENKMAQNKVKPNLDSEVEDEKKDE